jgi:hypothetical protein
MCVCVCGLVRAAIQRGTDLLTMMAREHGFTAKHLRQVRITVYIDHT